MRTAKNCDVFLCLNRIQLKPETTADLFEKTITMCEESDYKSTFFLYTHMHTGHVTRYWCWITHFKAERADDVHS